MKRKGKTDEENKTRNQKREMPKLKAREERNREKNAKMQERNKKRRDKRDTGIKQKERN
jgi:hypothetical protein